MAKVIKFTGNKTTDKDGFPVFKKVVDGEVFWCVDVDALSEFEQRRYFELRGGDAS